MRLVAKIVLLLGLVFLVAALNASALVGLVSGGKTNLSLDIAESGTSSFETGREFWYADEKWSAEGEFFRSLLSGDHYRIRKDLISGALEFCRVPDGTCFNTRNEIFDAESRGLPPWASVIDPSLRARISTTNDDGGRPEFVNVIVELEGGTLSDVALDVWEAKSTEIGELRGKGEIVQLRGGIGHETPKGGVVDGHLLDLSRAEVSQGRAILGELDRVLDRARGEIYARAEKDLRPLVREMERGIRSLHGELQGYTPVLPAVYARVPISSLPTLATFPAVAWIAENQPMQAAMDVSAYAIYADDWWNNGYMGGVWDLVVVDTGIDGTHPALTVDNASVFHTVGQGDPCYNDNPSVADDFHGHGTHIAGTVTSIDLTYRGVAFGMDELINAKAGWLCTDGGSYMYWSDGMDAIDWAIQAAGADVVSFSFGGSPGAGDTPMARYFDAVVDDLGVPAAVAVHNYGPGSGTVTEPALAYNVLSVGNMNDMDTVSRGDDIILASSGRGPTGDGRLKPDIVAPGTLIASANNDWESEADFVSWTGTSMATPHVAASVLLLMDERGAVAPLIYKALLLNSADDGGPPGPDSAYGWGYLNLREANLTRDNVYYDFLDDGPLGYHFYKGPISANERATLVWNRHVNYAGSDYPSVWYALNDLDLYAFNEEENSLVASSTSAINNVEQVIADADYSSIVYKLDAFGPFVGVTQEPYALSLEANVVPSSPPSLSVTMSVPASAELGGAFSISATVSNLGELNAHSVKVTLHPSIGMTLISGANPQSVGTIAPGTDAVASWQIRGDSVGPKTLASDSVSNSYGEVFAGESEDHTVLIVDTVPPASFVEALPVYEGTAIFTVLVTASDLSEIAGVELFYRKDGGTWTSYGVDTAAPWSWNFNSSITGGDGSYEFYSMATDVQTNTEPKLPGAEASTTVDILPPASMHTLSGTLGQNGWYTSTVTVTLTASDATSGVTSVAYRIDGGAWTTYVGPFTVDGGDHTVEYNATDAAGNAEEVNSVPLKVDTVKPSIVIVVPAIDSLLDSVTITVSGTASDDISVSGVELSTDASSWVLATGTASWSGTLTLVEGSNTLYARATDVAGNTETAGITVTVDTVAPETSLSPAGTLGENGWYTSTVTVTLTASDATSGVISVAYRIDGGVWQEYMSPFTFEGDGVQTVEYYSTDVAGNEEVVNSFDVKIDTTSPSLSISSPAAGAFLATGDIEVTWAAADATSGIDHFEVVLDDGTPVVLPATATSHTFTGAADGAHTVTITAFDVAGTSVVLSVDLTVDTNILSITGPYGSGPLVGMSVGIIAAAVAAALLLRRRRAKSRG